MYPEPALVDQIVDFFDAARCGIVILEGAVGFEPAILDSKNGCDKEIPIAVIKGAVDEYVAIVICWRQRNNLKLLN